MAEELFCIAPKVGITVTKRDKTLVYGYLQGTEPLPVVPHYNSKGEHQRRGSDWLWESRNESPFGIYRGRWLGSYTEGTIIATRVKGDAQPHRRRRS